MQTDSNRGKKLLPVRPKLRNSMGHCVPGESAAPLIEAHFHEKARTGSSLPTPSCALYADIPVGRVLYVGENPLEVFADPTNRKLLRCRHVSVLLHVLMSLIQAEKESTKTLTQLYLALHEDHSVQAVNLKIALHEKIFRSEDYMAKLKAVRAQAVSAVASADTAVRKLAKIYRQSE